MTTATVTARYDTIGDARRAIDDLLEASLPPRAITAEVDQGPMRAYVPVGIGTRAVQGTIIGGVAGLTIGMMLTSYAIVGGELPMFLDGLLMPNAFIGGIKALLATGSLGVVAGAATGFARSRVMMAAPALDDDDDVRITVRTPSDARMRTAITVLSRTNARELTTVG